MNKTERMLAIVIELQRKGVLRAEDLAGRFETSVRTIYRDMQALSEMGVPVAGEPGVGYALMEGYFLPPVSFTAEEAMALLVGADFVELRLDAEYGASARSSQEKIEAILPESVRKETDRLRSAIRLLNDRTARTRGEEKETFEQLRRAIVKKRKVRFRYSKNLPGPDGSRHSERTADPYGLVFSQGAWVLVAFCGLRGDVRHFRLSRMKELVVLEESFEVLSGFNLHNRRYIDERNVIVRMLVDPAVADLVQGSDNFYMESFEPGEEGWLATFRVRQVEELIQWTLGWGAAVRVLEPESLRDRMRAEIENMRKRY
ncbi:Predicted DNA-binding transcriptional regulator YafY, contains an HTH and WYL domains [Cohnella sp. OV330]|uniref:helix-turn-helix transcriptional regulator n=1 Tax=Cohnella sp. OV330 TaxID=1855288 RepID=UPI0008EFB2D7|nr:YafY family protein [Cohnella sp. OV330]SFB52095.1 Predicted DNA-binding transcriptional regulator YafY, contains an HTH and WYL domains [Cohnella sp. OV330]